MMLPSRLRLLMRFGLLAFGLVLIGVLLRIVLITRGIDVALKRAGATEIRFHVAQASPWRLVVEDVGFLIGLQPFSAGRVTLERAHWWTPSFGGLRIEQARVPINLVNLHRRTAAAEEKPERALVPNSLPFEQLTIDGELVIHASGAADQALSIRMEARYDGEEWAGTARVAGPGLSMEGLGRLHLENGEGSFELPEVALDLKSSWGLLQQLLPVPVEEWEIEGKLTGRVMAQYARNQLTAGGTVSLREGRLVHPVKELEAGGIEADLEFTDFENLVTKPGTLRVRELRSGRLVLRDLHAAVGLSGGDRIEVTRLSVQSLGGNLSTEPFHYSPSAAELDVVVLVDGISVEEVMGLTQNLPATATGRVDGRLPVEIGADGIQFGTGWLALEPGSFAEIQFHAKGLLTGGTAPGSTGFAVLEKIEAGMLKLRISDLRLDVRPPHAPAGRSAQLHLKGEPVDPQVKAPVTLDLNVNGPLERLLKLGMDSRVSIGSGK
jgi:hypothetical protein